MKKLHWIILLVFINFYHSGNAQLSGTYTIGDSTCTFHDFQQACDSLNQAGTAGNVYFVAQDGNYSSFSLSGYQPTHPSDTLFFQSESSVANDVVILGEIRVINSSMVKFSYIRFEPVSGQQYSCVSVSGSNAVYFDHCAFINPFSNCFTSMEALLSIEFPFSGNPLTVTVSDSKLESPEYTLYVVGARGIASFVNDTITGAVDCFNSGVSINYTGNVINLFNPDFAHTGQTFRGNTFYGGNLYIQGDFYNNIFYCGVDMFAGKVFNNHFYGPFSSSHNLVRINGNIFDQTFNLDYAYNSIIDRNRFFGEATFVGGSMALTGNMFYEDAAFHSGPNYQIKQNNFHPDAMLLMTYTSGTVENNNLGNFDVWQPQITTISNNNFIPHESAFVSVHGTNPFFYAPVYVSAQDLHATNPALIRKSTPLYIGTPGILYDFDSIPRKAIPTIGANEICFNFQSDTITLKCDSLCLDLCPGNYTGYYWTPSSLFKDSASVNPVIHPGSSCWIFLHEQNAGIADSVFLDVRNSSPQASGTAVIADLTVHFTNSSVCADSIKWVFGDGTTAKENDQYHRFPKYGLYECKLFAYNSLGTDSLSLPLVLTCLPVEIKSICGDSVSLETCIADFTGFYWSPSYLFSDSSEANPVIFPERQEYVFLNNVNSTGFASSYLFVYPAVPQASLTFTNDSLLVYFSNKTKCADSVRWDFGDGTSSTERDPVHLYPALGVYAGKLYAFSLTGSDTALFSINIMGIDPADNPGFKIWPNPASGYLIVDPPENFKDYAVSILDLSGRKVYESTGIRNRKQIDVGPVRPGMYVVRIQTANQSYLSKVVIL